MEYLKPYIGKVITRITRLDHCAGDYNIHRACSLFLQFVNEAYGIQIITDNFGDEILCSIVSYEIFSKQKLDGYGDINNLEDFDPLTSTINQKLESIHLGYYHTADVLGNGITIQKVQLQVIAFEFENKELSIANSGDEIWIEVTDVNTSKIHNWPNVEWKKLYN